MALAQFSLPRGPIFEPQEILSHALPQQSLGGQDQTLPSGFALSSTVENTFQALCGSKEAPIIDFRRRPCPWGVRKESQHTCPLTKLTACIFSLAAAVKDLAHSFVRIPLDWMLSSLPRPPLRSEALIPTPSLSENSPKLKTAISPKVMSPPEGWSVLKDWST